MKGIPVRTLETEGDLAAGAARLVELEPRFGPVVAAGPLPLRRRADGFAALLSAIVAQQVSTASAAAIWARVAAAGLDREEAWDAVEDATLIACGLSRPKQRYGRALAAAGIDWAALSGRGHG
jgi:DNA-3-methyladenine glycosylase II